MSPTLHVLLSGSLTFGVPTALAVRELVLLRRGDRGRRPDRAPMTPVAPKPLPDCLIPKPMPRPRAPERVPELAV